MKIGMTKSDASQILFAPIKKFKNLSTDRILIGLVYLFVALLPLTYRGTIEVGFTIKLSEIVALVGFSLWIILRLKRKDFSWRRTPLDISLIGFLVVTALSLSGAINLERGIAWWIWLSFYIFAVYYLIVNVVKEEKHVRGLLKVYIVTAAVVAFFSIYQLFAEYMGFQFTLLNTCCSKSAAFPYPQVHATLKEPLLFSHYLLTPTIFLSVSFLSKKTLFFKTWVEGSLLLLFTTVILSTVSRGGIISLGGALLLLILGYLGLAALNKELFKKVFASAWPRLAVFIVTVTLSLPIFWGMTQLGVYLERVYSGGFVYSRVYSLPQLARLSLESRTRLSTFKQGWQLFREKPILGVGWGNFGPTTAGEARGIVGSPEEFNIVNNLPLEIATESGIFGLIFYLWFSVTFVWQIIVGMFQAIQHKFHSWVLLFSGFLLSFLAMSAQFLTFSTIQIGHYWFTLGLGISALLIFKMGLISEKAVQR